MIPAYASHSPIERPIKKNRPWVLLTFTVVGLALSSLLGRSYIDSYAIERRALLGLPAGHTLRIISLLGKVQLSFEQPNYPYLGLLASAAEELDGEMIARSRDGLTEMSVYELCETSAWPIQSIPFNRAHIISIDYWLFYAASITETQENNVI